MSIQRRCGFILALLAILLAFGVYQKVSNESVGVNRLLESNVGLKLEGTTDGGACRPSIRCESSTDSSPTGWLMQCSKVTCLDDEAEVFVEATEAHRRKAYEEFNQATNCLLNWTGPIAPNGGGRMFKVQVDVPTTMTRPVVMVNMPWIDLDTTSQSEKIIVVPPPTYSCNVDYDDDWEFGDSIPVNTLLAYTQEHRFTQMISASDANSTTHGKWDVYVSEDIEDMVMISVIEGGRSFSAVQSRMLPYLSSASFYTRHKNPHYQVSYPTHDAPPPSLSFDHLIRAKTDDIIRHVMWYSNRTSPYSNYCIACVLTEAAIVLNPKSSRSRIGLSLDNAAFVPDLSTLLDSWIDGYDYDFSMILRYPHAARNTIHNCAWRCRLSEELYNLMEY